MNHSIYGLLKLKFKVEATRICQFHACRQIVPLFVNFPIQPTFCVSKRHLPKPVKPTQYKQDFRQLQNTDYTTDPIEIEQLGGRNPDTGK